MNTEQIAEQLRDLANLIGATPQPDPYAKLKAAHKEGKVIQRRVADGWTDDTALEWNWTPDFYRIKPSTPPFQLPPPPPGMSWHREDGWTAEMLPQGYRPVCFGEKTTRQSCESMIQGLWYIQSSGTTVSESHRTAFIRTRRPLTFTHLGQTWTYHRPGEPMPCDGETKVFCVGGFLVSDQVRKVSDWYWGELGEQAILGWRYADTPSPKTVELGPEGILKKFREAVDILEGYLSGSK